MQKEPSLMRIGVLLKEGRKKEGRKKEEKEEGWVK